MPTFSTPGIRNSCPLPYSTPLEWTHTPQLPTHTAGPASSSPRGSCPPGCSPLPPNPHLTSPFSGNCPRQHSLVPALGPTALGVGAVYHRPACHRRLWAALHGDFTHQACGFLFISPRCRLHWEWGLRWYVSCLHSFSMAPSASPSCRDNHRRIRRGRPRLPPPAACSAGSSWALLVDNGACQLICTVVLVSVNYYSCHL